MEQRTKDEQLNIDLLGSMLSYPRTVKAEILFGDSSDENIAKVDELQNKHYPLI